MNNIALIFSDAAPSESHKERFIKFLKNKYHDDYKIAWVESPEVKNGFRLLVGNEEYDWSQEGLLNQVVDTINTAHMDNDQIITLLKGHLESFEPEAIPDEAGIVITVGDGIAKIRGLENAVYGEIILFENDVKGMIQSLGENEVGCILFDDDDVVTAGSRVKRTRRTAGIPVGYNFLGRVVNALGVPIDGRGDIKEDGYRAIESPAPGIIDRSPVNTPLETGILAIDSMFPIGRGQRELIIGDRQTGKTAIALDTIINQKDKDCICIYVAIGQKASSVSQLVANLEKHDALSNTIVVAATASDNDPMLYIAPYAGCAMGEFFMNQGKDVLIVYDDLSKHAVSFRTISLLLGRSPGREAYPGDVFYLHSRLLERSAKLSKEKGGGSMTALPIVETQDGDVSAYIPTNIISITDGQIYLENELFFSGQRPAVNVGLSVSRVGGDAQTKALKKAVGSLKLSLAQYREMVVFTQFATDLEEDTQKMLVFGKALMNILIQKQFNSYSQIDQIIILLISMAHLLDDIDKKDVSDFLVQVIDYIKDHCAASCKKITMTQELFDDTKDRIIENAREFKDKWKTQN